MSVQQITIEPKTESTIDLVFRTIQATAPETLQRLVQETLGPVLALEAKTSKTLVLTIDAMHRFHRDKAAKELGISTKTLGRRWRRIGELTGLRLALPADRLRLDLALYALRSLQNQ